MPDGMEQEQGDALDQESLLLDATEIDFQADDQQQDFGANLVDILDRSVVNSITSDLLHLIEQDRDSRKKRDQQYKKGMQLTGMGGDTPGGADFNGAAKTVHPVLAEACVDFSAAAIKELMPPDGPVKMHQIDRGNKADFDRAERKRDFMNWQLTEQMPEYRSELEILLTQQPLGGSQYLKLWPDPVRKRPFCEFVPIDDVILPFSASSFDSAPRRTLVVRIDRLEFRRRIESGMYKDPGYGEPTASSFENSSAELANWKIEGKEEPGFNEDGLRILYEVYVWLDPEEEISPYILTIDEYSRQCIGFYRNWDPNDELREEEPWVVEFPFIPWRGAQGIGLYHLIGGLASAATGALRALLDSALIENSPGGVKLKGSRASGSSIAVNATEIVELDAPATVDDIRKVFMAWPFKGPSPTLFQLLGFIVDAAKGVVSTAEEKIAEASNQMPVGTAMALIEQGSKAFSAIHLRLHNSQAKVLRILQRINSKGISEPAQLKKFGRVIVSAEDFMVADDIVPVSDPNIFSETQRFAQNQSLQQMSADQTVPWNKIAIYRRMMSVMKVENPDEILPTPPEPYTNQEAYLEALPAMSGSQLRADMEQNHMQHIIAHLQFILDPVFGAANPTIISAGFQTMMNHVQEHLQMLRQGMQTQAIQQAQAMVQMNILQQVSANVPPQFVQMAMQGAIQQAQPVIQQQTVSIFNQMREQLAPIVQMMQQADELVRKQTPPPPQDPAVQAQVQIAQMEIDRKSKLDQASLQLNQQEQIEKTQREKEQQQFDNQMSIINQRMEEMSMQMSNATELQKNNADNHQRQMTELIKNNEDNRTNLMMEQMKQQGLQLKADLEQQQQKYEAHINALTQIAMSEKQEEVTPKQED